MLANIFAADFTACNIQDTMKKPSFIALLILASTAFGEARVSSVDSIGFQAVGPAGLKINGTTQAIELSAAGDQYRLKVPLDTVTTGIGLRDRHMKEKYLETARFPFAELTISKSALKEGKGQSTKAQFQVHGVKKTLDVSYDVVRAGADLSVRGAFQINIKDYGIEVPSYLGVTVKPDVKVNSNFKIRP